MKMTEDLSATPNGAHQHITDYMQQRPVAQPAKNVRLAPGIFFLLLPSSGTSNPARNVTMDLYNHSCILDLIDLYVIMKAGL
jgi:hypothetical protein